MISRRRFLIASAGMALALPMAARAKSEWVLRIGLVADPQYADVPPLKTRFYRNSIQKLAEAVGCFNDEDLDLCVNLGDLIDRDWTSYGVILDPIKKSRHRFYHVLGNHDFEVADDLKKRVPGRLGMRRRRYYLDRGPFRLVMLDTTEISPYAVPEQSAEHQAAVAELNRLREKGPINAQPWNGAVSDRQLNWFEDTVRQAAKRGLKVIAFSHHPIYPENAHNVWNAQALLGIIARQKNIVAWFNGHNHVGGFGELGGVPFVTLKGMVETELTNAFGEVRFQADGCRLIGFGRELSRELRFRAG